MKAKLNISLKKAAQVAEQLQQDESIERLKQLLSDSSSDDEMLSPTEVQESNQHNEPVCDAPYLTCKVRLAINLNQTLSPIK